MAPKSKTCIPRDEGSGKELPTQTGVSGYSPETLKGADLEKLRGGDPCKVAEQVLRWLLCQKPISTLGYFQIYLMSTILSATYLIQKTESILT